MYLQINALSLVYLGHWFGRAGTQAMTKIPGEIIIYISDTESHSTWLKKQHKQVLILI